MADEELRTQLQRVIKGDGAEKLLDIAVKVVESPAINKTIAEMARAGETQIAITRPFHDAGYNDITFIRTQDGSGELLGIKMTGKGRPDKSMEPETLAQYKAAERSFQESRAKLKYQIERSNPTVTIEERDAVLHGITLTASDGSLGKWIPKARETLFQTTADKFSDALGVPVTLSKIRDFEGFPKLEIKVGNNKAQAEAVIDRLIIARKRAGIERYDMPFSSDDEGNILVDTTRLLHEIPGNGFILKEKLFNALEEHKGEFRDTIKVRGESPRGMIDPAKVVEQVTGALAKERFAEPKPDSGLHDQGGSVAMVPNLIAGNNAGRT